ncbi:hypothetical protein COCVIDRAFT_87547 [Bipolaris victoriae FI3]|uniref:Uncharacterized protein n=1 Tax=Bipolaris victoriae (strain FI3) TaxID=930091 RepID=W7F6L1_BIPV3|nr:hypothetical protein COCVIDRAFT_87547 [Bipolaris victoriae FI3]
MQNATAEIAPWANHSSFLATATSPSGLAPPALPLTRNLRATPSPPRLCTTSCSHCHSRNSNAVGFGADIHCPGPRQTVPAIWPCAVLLCVCVCVCVCVCAVLLRCPNPSPPPIAGFQHEPRQYLRLVA